MAISTKILIVLESTWEQSPVRKRLADGVEDAKVRVRSQLLEMKEKIGKQGGDPSTSEQILKLANYQIAGPS